MASLDSDGDGTLSRGELAVFLASPAASAAESTGIVGSALRTALLTRFAGHAGASLVRRASSEGSVEPVKPDATTMSGKFSIGHHDEAGAPLSLKVSLRSISDLPSPPPGLASGKGLAITMDTFDGADVEAACAGITTKLAESPLPLPHGVAVSVEPVTVDGDACIALYVDAPMLSFPPELGVMFGVGDLAEAVAGLEYDLSVSASKSVDDVVHSSVPVASGLTLDIDAKSTIPKHVLNVALNLLKLLGAGSPFASMAPPGVASLVGVYASMFKVLDDYSIKASLNSADELVDMAESVLATAPSSMRDEIGPMLELAKSVSFGDMHAGVVESLLSGFEGLGQAEVLMVRSLKGLRSIQAFVGPLGINVQATGLTIPYLREAADMMG
jgi:hypothetical protein